MKKWTRREAKSQVEHHQSSSTTSAALVLAQQTCWGPSVQLISNWVLWNLTSWTMRKCLSYTWLLSEIWQTPQGRPTRAAPQRKGNPNLDPCLFTWDVSLDRWEIQDSACLTDTGTAASQSIGNKGVLLQGENSKHVWSDAGYGFQHSIWRKKLIIAERQWQPALAGLLQLPSWCTVTVEFLAEQKPNRVLV